MAASYFTPPDFYDRYFNFVEFKGRRERRRDNVANPGYGV
jgi:hypothetical protein